MDGYPKDARELRLRRTGPRNLKPGEQCLGQKFYMLAKKQDLVRLKMNLRMTVLVGW